MTRSNSTIAAIILAAGKSKRFGAPKVLQIFNGVPFLTRIRKNLQSVGIERPFLILGYQAQSILPQLPEAEKFRIVVNSEYEQGMFASVRAGIKALPESIPGTLLCLIDQPHIRPDTYRRLMQSAAAHPHSVIIPTFEKRGGHPVYLPSALFGPILKSDPQNTLKDILNQYPHLILRPETDDPGILDDIDRPDELIRLETIARKQQHND